MSKNTKLELTWIGKEKRPKLEPRILIEDPELSYHASGRVSESDFFDNRLIHGDNLLALKALEQEFTGKIKCVYIDPPFNTGGAFEHYDDNVEHSLWLTLMHQRLELLYGLLAPTGAIVVNLDDTEMAYCKVVLDEVFGRKNYITTMVVEAATPSSFKTVNTGPLQVTQYLLFYAKDKSQFTYIPQSIPTGDVDLEHFSRFIENYEDKADEWRFQSINDHILTQLGFRGDTPNKKWTAAKAKYGEDQAKLLVRQHAISFALDNCHRVFETKTLQKPSRWLHEHIDASLTTDHVIELPRDGMESIYLYKGRQLYFLGKGVKHIDGEAAVVQPLSNLWTDIPTNNLKKEGGVDFPAGKKPEMLIARIIRMITDSPEDWVLDSFGGSGTTAAVAHKLKHRWITIESKEHCTTHIIPRLRAVVDGSDPNGVTKECKWRGGGGFRYYRLAPSLLERDQWDNWVISKQFNSAMLAEAVCKLEGFTYAPSQERYWQHGHSTERDYIYVTTQKLTHQQLHALSEEVGPERSLLVCCAAFRGSGDQWPNLTLKKIPKAVMERCEWGRDDYSLSISKLPAAEFPDVNGDAEPPTAKKKAAPKKAKVAGQADLFGGEGEEA